MCAIEAFLACSTFYRTDLCERVGLYPRQNPQDDYDLYFDRGIDDPFGPDPALVQYRLLRFNNLDERYSPPLLVIHMQVRDCYRFAASRACGSWRLGYAIISHLDTAEPSIDALGGVTPTHWTGWLPATAADSTGIPSDLPIDEIGIVRRDWHPYACPMSDGKKVVCAIKALLACRDFHRTDLCEFLDLYPSLVAKDSHDLYGESGAGSADPEPVIEQYRLLEFSTLDTRYSPPLLLVHGETRACDPGGPPPRCDEWGHQYFILSHLNTTVTRFAAWGMLASQP